MLPPKITIPGPILGDLLALKSKWAQTPLEPTLSIMDNAWSDAGMKQYPNCWVWAKNDAKFLYIALDVIGDTGNDAGTGDYFWLTFDVDENKGITSGADLNYAPYPNNPNKLGKQTYLGPGQWTGLSVPPESECRIEFGPSPKLATPHRIWKMKIALTEIQANLNTIFVNPYTNFGFRVSSNNPAFTSNYPANFYTDFSKLTKLIFARKPAIDPVLLGQFIGSVGLVPASASIIGANGRATTASNYFLPLSNAAFGGTLNLIANRTTVGALIAANGASKYKILHAAPGSAVYTPLVSAWTNYRWNGTDYILESFAPDSNGFYRLTNPAEDYSIDDLLIQFSTMGMDTGIHNFKVEFYQSNGTPILPAPTQVVGLYIDNELPNVFIDSIKHGATEVTACAIETIGASPDGLSFKITANDPQGNLRSYGFGAYYGENQYVHIYGQDYSTAVPAGSDWNGPLNQPVPTGANPWRPPMRCAFTFVVSANARTTNGYSYIGQTSFKRSLTLLV